MSEDSMNIFGNLFGNEELNEELRDHIKDGPLGKMIHHPLIIQVVYHEQMNKMLNMQIKQKHDMITAHLRARNYEGYIFTHERPYRLEALLEVVSYIKPEDYWKIVRAVYVDTENAHEFREEWENLFSEPIDVPADMIGAELPETVNVYRGYTHDGGDGGFSWTIDHEKAVWFAKRYSKTDEAAKPRVAAGVVKRSNIIMYIDSRGESEVVVLPENVDVVEIKLL